MPDGQLGMEATEPACWVVDWRQLQGLQVDICPTLATSTVPSDVLLHLVVEQSWVQYMDLQPKKQNMVDMLVCATSKLHKGMLNAPLVIISQQHLRVVIRSCPPLAGTRNMHLKVAKS